jgi:hypothetical protein
MIRKRIIKVRAHAGISFSPRRLTPYTYARVGALGIFFSTLSITIHHILDILNAGFPERFDL